MVYVSLGSNLGDREANLRAGIAKLNESGLTLERVSSVYETAPQDLTDQPWFLNICAGGLTALSPIELLAKVREIEAACGRKRDATAVRAGPRLLDIDILFYADQIVATPDLTIPHPRLLNRRFVLEPLLEIATDLVHPETHRPLRDYLAAALSQEVRKRVSL